MHSNAYTFPCCHYFCQKHIDICRTFELKRKLVFVVAKSLKGCLCGLFTSADGERRVKSNIGFVVPTKNCLASLSPKHISNVAGYDKSLIFPAQGVSPLSGQQNKKHCQRHNGRKALSTLTLHLFFFETEVSTSFDVLVKPRFDFVWYLLLTYWLVCSRQHYWKETSICIPYFPPRPPRSLIDWDFHKWCSEREGWKS